MNIADISRDAEKSLTPFWQAHLSNVLLSGLALLVFVFFASYPWNGDLASYMRESKGPFVFFPVFAAAAVIYAYSNVRCGRGEFIITELYIQTYDDPTAPPIVTLEEERDIFGYALPVFVAHTAFLLLPALPIFLLSAAISGLPFAACWAGVGIVFTVALSARWIGFWLLLVFGHKSMTSYFLSRAAIPLLLVSTIAAWPAYNPLRCLYALHVGGVTRAWSWNGDYWRVMALMTFIMLLFEFLCHLRHAQRRKQAAQRLQPAPRRRRGWR